MTLIVCVTGCKPKPTAESSNLADHVDWSRRATIYEVNIRQYTPQIGRAHV